jgi:hypothetical protein
MEEERILVVGVPNVNLVRVCIMLWNESRMKESVFALHD